MNEKEAREHKQKYSDNHPYQFADEIFMMGKVRGYLEAIEKAKTLKNMLFTVQVGLEEEYCTDNDSHQVLLPTIKEILFKWEKEK